MVFRTWGHAIHVAMLVPGSVTDGTPEGAWLRSVEKQKQKEGSEKWKIFLG